MKSMLTVFQKELADHLLTWRGIILFCVVVLVAAIAIFGPSGALENIRGELATPAQFGGEFVFLRLFTASGEGTPSFLYFFSTFFIPIVGIVLGFDAINSERNSGTLSRVLSQPIYRDAVFNGKFFAGMTVIAIMVTTVILLISGLGIRFIGVPPTSEEAFRLFLFFGISMLYGAFWLGLAMLFSVFLSRIAASALASIAIWIFFIFFSLTIGSFVADILVPIDQTSTNAELIRNIGLQLTVSRVSPITLFGELTTIVLAPGARTASETLQIQTASGARWMPGQLTLGESLLTVWPHLLTLVAISAACFAASYIKLMREEIRAT